MTMTKERGHPTDFQEVMAVQPPLDDRMWAVLGGLVLKRREFLGFAQHQLPFGPSPAMVRKIEKAESAPLRPKTISCLEQSLGWQDGSVLDVLVRRGTPTVVADPREDRPGIEVEIRAIRDMLAAGQQQGQGSLSRRAVELSKDAWEKLGEISYRTGVPIREELQNAIDAYYIDLDEDEGDSA